MGIGKEKAKEKCMAKGNQHFDCAVIGAGASGMMAAIAASEHSGRVLLIEHTNKVGKKLAATGNGKCNFTNANMQEECFRGDPALLPVLRQFTLQDTLDFFHRIGIYPREKRGYYYPNSEQAASVVCALTRKLIERDVTMLLSYTLTDVREEKRGFALTDGTSTYYADSVVFAVGLLASDKLGSDGSAFSFIKKFGHHFTKIVPALCGLYAGNINFKRVAGVRCDAGIRLLVDGREAAHDIGELQLTEYGLSGIPVFQVSRFASMALANGQKVIAEVCFLPEFTKAQLREEFTYRLRQQNGAVKAYDLLDGLVNQKLIPFLLHHASLSEDSQIRDIRQLDGLIAAIRHFEVEIDRPRAYEFAQVCAGGLDTRDIDTQTLMSKLVPGVFFCGELLDVDGICGGYNLQWAWSSGYVAGKNAADYAKKGKL